MVNGLQTGMGSEPSECVTSCSVCFPAQFFWSMKVLFGFWVLGWPLLCLWTNYPGALLHICRPRLLFHGSGRDHRIGWQKQSGVNLGNITLSFVCFTSTFSKASAPGSSSPLSVALFPFECSLFNVLRSPFSYAVVRIRSIPICYSREEEFWFFIQCMWHSLSASSLFIVTAPSPTSCSSDREWIFTNP